MVRVLLAPPLTCGRFKMHFSPRRCGRKPPECLIYSGSDILRIEKSSASLSTVSYEVRKFSLCQFDSPVARAARFDW